MATSIARLLGAAVAAWQGVAVVGQVAESVHPQEFGTRGQHRLRLFGEGLRFAQVRLVPEGRAGGEAVLCEYDAAHSAANGEWVACEVPELAPGSYKVVASPGHYHPHRRAEFSELRAAAAAAAAADVTCDDCVVQARLEHNAVGLVDENLAGCAGETIHITSPHFEHWLGLQPAPSAHGRNLDAQERRALHEAHQETAEAQLRMMVGGHVAMVDAHSARLRRAAPNMESALLHERATVHQLHVAIPEGLEAGEHDLEVFVEAHHHMAKVAHGKLELQHLHRYHTNASVAHPRSARDSHKVLVRPTVHSAVLDVHTGLVTITGTGFSRQPEQMEVSIGQHACNIQRADPLFLVLECPGVETMAPGGRAVGAVEEEIGVALQVERDAASSDSFTPERETVFVRNELEWPVDNPAVRQLSHFQTGVFNATAAPGTVFVAPADGTYWFESHCRFTGGRIMPERCQLDVGGATEDAPATLRRGDRLPIRLFFAHEHHGDNMRISVHATIGGNLVVLHTMPASWTRHTRLPPAADAPRVVVNGILAAHRGDRHPNMDRDCRLQVLNLRRTHVPPPPPPPPSRQGDAKTSGLRRRLQAPPAGAAPFSAWRAQQCPGTEDDCVIAAGSHVYLDQDADVGSLTVHGEFTWSDAAVPEALTLRTGFFVVEKAGRALIDARAQPAQQQTLFIKNNNKVHPELGKRVLGTFGLDNDSPELVLEGAELQRTWSVLVANVEPGATQLVLEHEPAAMGWRVGDRVALAPTMQIGGQSPLIGPEVFTIAAMAGNTLTLSAGVSALYLGMVDRKMQAEVLNLRRNLVVTGDEMTGSGEGLHTISSEPGGFMRVRHTRVERCGQHGVLGKYCLHAHLKGTCPQCVFEGNAVEEGSQRGLVAHGSHRTVWKSNVLYRVRGAGLYIEDGNELNNRFEDNVNLCDPTQAILRPCQTAGTDNPASDFTFQSGAWSLSSTNDFIGNRFIGHENAIFLQTTAFGHGKGNAQGKVCTRNAPFGVFRGNVQHNSMRFNFYPDSNFPRRLARSEDTNGLVTDFGSCRGDIAAPCSCEPFTASGEDNGAHGNTVEDSVDYNAIFVGQYDLGDVQYRGMRSYHNGHDLYWKVTKPFADGRAAHLLECEFGQFPDTPGYVGRTTGNVLGPGGRGAFGVESTKFFGAAGMGLASNQHCGVGTTGGGCAPEYTLRNVDFSGMAEGTRWIQFGVSDGDTTSPMYTSLDASSLPEDIVSVASSYQQHLLSIRDASNNAVCFPSTDRGLERRFDNGILCTQPVRRLQLWRRTPIGEVTITAPGGGSIPMHYMAPDGRKGSYTATVVVPSSGPPLRYVISAPFTEFTVEFSDTVFSAAYAKADSRPYGGPDSIELEFANGLCTATSSHDRLFISQYGPYATERGACRGLPDMPTTPPPPTPTPPTPPTPTPPTPPTPTPPTPTPPTPTPPTPTPPTPPTPPGECTITGGDTWSTGANLPCCDRLVVECLADWAPPAPQAYRCVTVDQCLSLGGVVVTTSAPVPVPPAPPAPGPVPSPSPPTQSPSLGSGGDDDDDDDDDDAPTGPKPPTGSDELSGPSNSTVYVAVGAVSGVLVLAGLVSVLAVYRRRARRNAAKTAMSSGKVVHMNDSAGYYRG